MKIKQFLTPTILLFFIGLAGLAAFVSWYSGSKTPLSAAEQQYYLERLAQQSDEIVQFLDIETTEKFLQSDDGRGFYVLNLFKFNDKALYEGTEKQAISGEQAFDQFSQKVIPLWLAKGSHPIFASSLEHKDYSEWDFVSLVRYRSRRDFITIQSSDEFIAALPDRIAASKENLRVRISGNQIPIPVILFLFVFILVCLLTITSILKLNVSNKITPTSTSEST